MAATDLTTGRHCVTMKNLLDSDCGVAPTTTLPTIDCWILAQIAPIQSGKSYAKRVPAFFVVVGRRRRFAHLTARTVVMSFLLRRERIDKWKASLQFCAVSRYHRQSCISLGSLEKGDFRAKKSLAMHNLIKVGFMRREGVFKFFCFVKGLAGAEIFQFDGMRKDQFYVERI